MKYIVIHCSATKEGEHFTAKDIHRWHKKKGWSGIGYHYVVSLDGTIEKARPEYWSGAHVRGFNDQSIGICYIGGLNIKGKAKDTRTESQKEALCDLLVTLKQKYKNAQILGHSDFPNVKKDCPCFNVKTEYQYLK